MDLKISGKKAVILASTKGLGKATATALAAEGVDVAICGRTETNVDSTLQELRQAFPKVQIIGQATDVSDATSLSTFFDFVLEQFGQIDILVTNAGGPPAGFFDDFEDAHWQSAIELNLLSAIRSIRRVLPSMKQNGWGRILSLTSIAVKAPVKNLILSNTVRAGVTGMIKSLANEVARYGITANTVCPGLIETERLGGLAAYEASQMGVDTPEVLKQWKSSIPLGRLGQPSEFASLIAYLCSEQAAYITGTTYWVDGGKYPGLL